MDKNQALVWILKPDIEFDVTLNNQTQKVYWKRLSFEDRIFLRAILKKKIKAAKEAGILYHIDKHSEEIELDGTSTTVSLDPYWLDETTLNVVLNDVKVSDYTYFPETHQIVFNEAPIGKLKIEYMYFDKEIYDTLFNNSYTLGLIFCCAYKDKERTVRLFKSIDELSSLSFEEVTDFLRALAAPSLSEIKNLQETPVSSSDTK